MIKIKYSARDHRLLEEVMISMYHRDAAHKNIEGTKMIEGEQWMLKRIAAIDRELIRMKIETHTWVMKPRRNLAENDEVLVHAKYKVIPFVGVYKYDGKNMFTTHAKLSLQMWMPTKDFASSSMVYRCGRDGDTAYIEYAGDEAVRMSFSAQRMQTKSNLLIALTEAVGRI